MWALFGCGGFLLVVFVVSLVGALFTRAAVSVSNRLLGPRKANSRNTTWQEWDDWEEWEAWDAQDRRRETGKRQPNPKHVIPEPNLGRAISISLLQLVFTALCGVLIWVIAEGIWDRRNDDTREITAFIGILLTPISMLIYALLLKSMLPTTFGRAVLVTVISTLLSVLLVALAGGVVALAWKDIV